MDYRTFVLLVLTSIAFFNGADQSVMAAVSAPVGREFGLNDSQIGALGSAFILVYALAVMPFGALADAGVRGRIIGVGVGIWSLATLASGLAPNYSTLLLARAAVGAGESSYLPAGNSLLGDLFRSEERAGALAWLTAGLRAGVGVGLIGGAAIAARLGWRAAFFVAGLPGLVFALLAFALREPSRGAAEAIQPRHPMKGRIAWSTYAALLRIPTLYAAVAVVTCGLFASAGIGYWVPALVQRRFALGVGPAGAIAGLPLLVGGLAGTFGGAAIIDRLVSRRPAAAVEVTAAAFALATVFAAVAFSATPLAVFVIAYALAVTCLAIFVPAMQAIAQAVVVPTRRATAITISLLVGNLLGQAFAPLAIGSLSDLFHDLSRSLLVASVTVCALAAAACAAGIRAARRDTRRMTEEWARIVETEESAPELAV